MDARREILERRQQREAEAAVKAPAGAPPQPVEEPPQLELDDLFRKTETLPVLYWLPVAKVDGDGPKADGDGPKPATTAQANGKGQAK